MAHILCVTLLRRSQACRPPQKHITQSMITSTFIQCHPSKEHECKEMMWTNDQSQTLSNETTKDNEFGCYRVGIWLVLRLFMAQKMYCDEKT